MVGGQYRIAELLLHESNSPMTRNVNYATPIYGTDDSSPIVRHLFKEGLNWLYDHPEYLVTNKIYDNISSTENSLQVDLTVNIITSTADINIDNSTTGVTYTYLLTSSNGGTVSNSGQTTGSSFSITNIDISSLTSGEIYLDFDIYATSSTLDVLIDPTFVISAENISYKDGNILAYKNRDDGFIDIIEIPFTRASKGNYTDKTNTLINANIDMPRVETKNNKTYILLEPTSTNLVTNNSINTPIMINGSIDPIITNNLKDPYGDNKAYSYTFNRDLGYDFNFRTMLSVTLTSGLYYSISFWLKGSEEFQVYVDVADNALDTFTVSTIWEKYSYNSFLYTDSSPGNFSDMEPLTTGYGTVSLSVYNYQVEQRETVTSEINTFGSSVTRLEDNFLGNIPNFQTNGFLGSTKGMLYMDLGDTDLLTGLVNSISMLTLNGSDSSKYFRIRYSGSLYIQILGLTTSTQFYGIDNIPRNLLFRWDGTSVSVFSKGLLLGTALQTVSFTPNTFSTNIAKLTFKLKEMRMYNEVMTDDNCKKLTKI